MDYSSVVVIDSRTTPGVRLIVRRMSFARRMDLMRRIRDLARKADFLRAGTEPGEQMEAALVRAEIERSYVSWGVREIEGLTVDGSPATPEILAERGPEELFREAVEAVKIECGLSEAEAKN